jgi:hypothetical protein
MLRLGAKVMMNYSFMIAHFPNQLPINSPVRPHLQRRPTTHESREQSQLSTCLVVNCQVIVHNKLSSHHTVFDQKATAFALAIYAS